MNWYMNLNYPIQALIASLFTWGITSLGAAVVFLFKKVNKNTMDAMLGLSAGVMLAATFWSLLSPALEMAENLKLISWLIVSLGVLSGGLLLFCGDKIFDRITKKKTNSHSIKRSLMLIFSITLHNIPEGMAIGVAFGSVFYNLEGATLAAAVMLAIGIGIQNFPEGSAVSLPLRREGMSPQKAFFFGMLSGIVEPISAVVGAVLVIKVQVLLPILLSFAGGAMIYVVVQELIPESQTNKKKDLMALFTILGFLLMMIFDVSLG
ncbi:MAG: ZIP family metal transporter [Bacilli bacterium]